MKVRLRKGDERRILGAPGGHRVDPSPGQRRRYFGEVVNAHRAGRQPRVPDRLGAEVQEVGSLKWIQLNNPSAEPGSQPKSGARRQPRRKKASASRARKKGKRKKGSKFPHCRHGRKVGSCAACRASVVFEGGSPGKRKGVKTGAAEPRLRSSRKSSQGSGNPQRKTALDLCIHGLSRGTCSFCSKRKGHPRAQEKNSSQALPESALDQLRTAFETPGLIRIVRKFGAQRDQIEKFLHDKWAMIDSDQREFGLAENRTYPVEVEVPLLLAAGITRIEFIGGVCDPPAVRVRVEFRSNDSLEFDLVGPSRISSSPPIQSVIGVSAERFLILVVIMYYLHLVISSEQTSSPGTSRSGPNKGNRSGTVRPKSGRGRSLPRIKSQGGRSTSRKRTRNASRSGSYVDVFRRRLPRGQRPSFEKILEADQYGIHLKGPGYPSVQYTWVRPHARAGGLEPSERYQYRDYQAIAVLETLIDSLTPSVD